MIAITQPKSYKFNLVAFTRGGHAITAITRFLPSVTLFMYSTVKDLDSVMSSSL